MTMVNVIGGLGNQMFQYAFGYAVSQINSECLKLDVSGYDAYGLRNFELGAFCIEAQIASTKEAETLKYTNNSIFGNFLKKLLKKAPSHSKNFYKEPHFFFDQNALNTGGGRYFEGYWQSAKYFEAFRNTLLKHFTLKKPLHMKSRHYERLINETESISIHIRRGDYVANASTNSVHGTCSLDYYYRAVSHIVENVSEGDVHFFVFSDDLGWAKDHFHFVDRLTFVEIDSHAPDFEEMYLMSICKHNIIANSSFSWWGAWLNENPRKIILAPRLWFADEAFDTRDLLPTGWIVL